jgi:hypothetical protein
MRSERKRLLSSSPFSSFESDEEGILTVTTLPLPPPSLPQTRSRQPLQLLQPPQNHLLTRLLHLTRQEHFVEDRVDFVEVEDEVEFADVAEEGVWEE